MKEVVSLIATAAGALAMVAAVVFAGGDTTILVSPPEAVAEEFTRKLAGGRYEPALEHLARREPVMVPVLRTSGRNLRTTAGAVDQVEGESSAIAGDTATAVVKIDTRDVGQVRWTFSLVRRNGEWKIEDWK